MTTAIVRESTVCDIHGTTTPKPYMCWNCWKEEQDKKLDLEQAIDFVRGRLNSTDVPPRYHDKTLKDFVTETPAQAGVLDIVQDYVWNFPANFARGRCLTFLGGIGTGKTLLASAALQTLVSIVFPAAKKEEDNHPGRIYYARYVTASGIIRRVRDTLAKEASTTTTAVIESYANVNLLVIDEIGAGAGTVSELSLLAEIVDLRYQRSSPTIAISNLGREGLIVALGEPGVDRLRDNDSQLCLFNWPSLRK
jgi:DNA replication protein DnaC